MDKASQPSRNRRAKSQAGDPLSALSSAAPPADLHAFLVTRAAEDGWAAGLGRLIEIADSSMVDPEGDEFPPPLRVQFDNRFEHCFEQMLALIHQQNVQIAELWQIISELI